jgi:UDP-N-acetylmuramyl pentapeptide phosphotransferase/UDP-N-acetylglucosamine-1-phosphate transferase
MSELVITGWPTILLAFVSAFAITWYYIPKVIKVVYKKHLSDRPGNHKIHKRDTPTLGGIGIFAGFIFGFLIGVNGYMHSVSYFTTVFIIVLVINAVNLIDGIDGLAASVGIIASLFFGVWFILSEDYGFAAMAAALLGSLIVFLFYNLSNGRMKIFMGDTGSIVIGFTLVVMAIRFNELDAAGRSFIDLASTPSVSIAVLIIPLYDTLRVILLRFKNHQSVFTADTRHIHHMMLRLGFSHKRATLYISIFNILIIAMALLLDGIGILWLGLVLLAICGIGTTILVEAVKRKESAAAGVARA